jgi:uncharacterized RDD family membrane protein YckC
LIVWVPVVLCWQVAYRVVYPHDPDRNNLAAVLLVSALVAAPVYHWLFTALGGQTLGKRLLRIKVVDARGRRPGWGRALWRETVGRFVMIVSLFLSALSYLFSNLAAYSMDNTSLNSYPELGYRKQKDREPLDVLGFYERFTGTYVVTS